MNLLNSFNIFKQIMSTVEEILDENDDFSSLSADPSFTLEDILQQPPQYIYEPTIEQDIDYFFNDDEEENIQEESVKPYDPYEKNKHQQLSASLPPQLIQFNKRMTEHSQLSMSKKQYTSIKRYARLRDLPITPFQQIQNMVYIMLKNVTKLFDTSEAKGVGIPNCISGTGSKFLALGTSMGNIALFEIEVDGYRILGSSQHRRYGQVTSVSISRDNRYIVGGYETGMIIVWDLYNFKMVKQQKVESCRIVKVLFCSETYENFVVINEKGYAYLFTIQNYFWLAVNYKLLIDHSGIVYYDIKYTKLESNRHILALCSLDYVILISMKPQIGIINKIERPQHFSDSKIPNCEIGKSQSNATYKSYDILCVSWGTQIYIYRLLSTNHSMEQLVHHFTINHPTTIHNLQLITNGILVTLDEHQVYRVINLEESFVHKKCEVISINEIQSETFYQRYLKDKKGKNIKLYSNTIVNCCFNTKYKEVFFISKDAIYRGRLQKWTDYVYKLIKEQKNWNQTLKLCLQLYNGRSNIFAQPFIINKVTMSLLCDIGRIFLKEGLKEIDRVNDTQTSIQKVREQAQQLFDSTIQYFIQIKCEEYLFNEISDIINKNYFYQYEEEFIRCFQSFICNNIIHKIPNHNTFLKIINEYEKKPQVLNKLILSLEQESLYYEDTVQLCTKFKLYQALSYICSVHGDFISPLTKMMNHLQQAVSSNYNNAGKKVYAYLQQYLKSILQLRYPSSFSRVKTLSSQHISLALSKISIWIGCRQNIVFLMKYSKQDFTKIFNKLITVLLQMHYEKTVHQINEQLMKLNNSNGNGNSKQNGMSQRQIGQFIINISDKIKLNKNEIQFILSHKQALTSSSDKYAKTVLSFVDNYFTEIKEIWNIHQIASYQLPTYLQLFITIINQSTIPISSPSSFSNSKQLVQYTLSYVQNNVISQYINQLIKWQPSLTITFMLNIYDIEEVSYKIQQIQDKRLKYMIVRKVAKIIRYGSSQKERHLSSDVMLFYVSSLCAYKKEKRIFVELTDNLSDYRSIMNKVLPILQQHKFASCLGFLYEQELNYHKAFEEYVQVYNDYFKMNYNKLIHYEHCHGRFMGKVYQRMLQLCFNIREESQWIKLLSCVLKPFHQQSEDKLIIDTIQRIFQKPSCSNHPFILQLLQIIESALINVNKEVPMKVLTHQLSNHINLLNKSFIINCLTSTLNNFSKRSQTYIISLKMLEQDMVRSFEDMFETNKVKGISVQQQCCRCGGVSDVGFNILSCGHGYHKMCIKQNECEVCLREKYGDRNRKYYGYEDMPLNKKNSSFIMHQPQLQNQQSKGVMNTVYKCLAFEDYMGNKDDEFENFVKEYEKHLQAI